MMINKKQVRPIKCNKKELHNKINLTQSENSHPMIEVLPAPLPVPRHVHLHHVHLHVIFFGPCFPYGILKHLIFKYEQNLFITKMAQWK